MVTPRCDVNACTQRTSPTAVFAYYFPQWLVARVALLTVKLSSYDGPQFSLRVSRVVDGNSNIFGYIQRGEIDNVRELLRQRVMSPFDVSHTKGTTVLMVSTYKRFSMSV